jgi:hypothetical protein
MIEPNARYELYERRVCEPDQEQDWLRAEQDEQTDCCRQQALPPTTPLGQHREGVVGVMAMLQRLFGGAF